MQDLPPENAQEQQSTTAAYAGPQRVVISPPAATATQATLGLVLLAVLIAIQGWALVRPVQKWEYKIEAVPDLSFPSDMQRLGDDGWELVVARRATSSGADEPNKKPEFSYEMVFKRPK